MFLMQFAPTNLYTLKKNSNTKSVTSGYFKLLLLQNSSKLWQFHHYYLKKQVIE